MDVSSSPPRYTDNGQAQVVVMAMIKASNTTDIPSISFSCDLSSGAKVQASNILMPIMITKLIENQSVAQMTLDAFRKNWAELSKNGVKADVILKNPAPAHVAVSDVMKQISQFTQSSLNMFIMPADPSENGYRVRAIGQAIFKPSAQLNFPTSS